MCVTCLRGQVSDTPRCWLAKQSVTSSVWSQSHCSDLFPTCKQVIIMNSWPSWTRTAGTATKEDCGEFLYLSLWTNTHFHTSGLGCIDNNVILEWGVSLCTSQGCHCAPVSSTSLSLFLWWLWTHRLIKATLLSLSSDGHRTGPCLSSQHIILRHTTNVLNNILIQIFKNNSIFEVYLL